jgi:haloalkane dehalogenase
LSYRRQQIGGLNTCWLDVGTGEMIVALHGIPTSSTLFQPLVAYLTDYRLVAPDLLGQGQTETPSLGKLVFSAYMRHLSQFLETVADPQVHLVVHDFGGLLGIRWACEHPQRIKSLVILSTLHSWDVRWFFTCCLVYGGNLVMGQSFDQWALNASLKAAHGRFKELMQNWSRPWTRRRILRGFDHFAPDHARKNRLALAELRAPTLIVWGENDVVFPIFQAKRFSTTVPHAKLVTIPGCGHWSPIDAPERVGQAIADFLAGLAK